MLKGKKENPFFIFNLDCFDFFFFFNHNFGFYYFPCSHFQELLIKTMFCLRNTMFFKVVEEKQLQLLLVNKDLILIHFCT